MDRKSFCKNYFLDLLEGIDNAFGEELCGFANKFPELVRPPGSCQEKEFTEKCSRCGNCVRACPFFALKPVTMANEFDLGTPALRLNESWCRFCDGFPCITACKSGALSFAAPEKLKKIATASIIPASCIRSEGKSCRACFEKCGETSFAGAVEISEDFRPPRINPDKCAGCGACLTVCPAYPEPAIILKP